tara:strand:+ start:2011 stop:3765 length:1755 start_codon:yes stop_codon:yes gene_type:complete
MATPPRRVGLSGVEVVSPELRKALGIKRPTNLLDPSQTANRPTGLGAVLFPESVIQSGQARTIMGGSPLSKGISPAFAQAVGGSPTGLDEDKLLRVSGMLPTAKTEVDTFGDVDAFKELNQAKVINDKFAGLEEDIVGVKDEKLPIKKSDIVEDPFVNVSGEDDGSGEDTTTDVDGADTPAKKATVKALDQFLKEARPGIKPKTFDEYINEFGEATGLDVSGEADTKQALMSFGLALMQNRAGKGFDISKILTSVGEAGEAAMPDFRAALSQAKAIRAKAGSYALSKKESDQQKAMNRQGYVVIPKEGGIANAILQSTGRFARLNSYELNNLMNSADFNDRFEIVDASSYNSMTKEIIKARDKGKDKDKKIYLEKPRSVPLFSGSKVTFDVFYANPNNPTGAKDRIVNPEMALNAIETMEKGLTRRVDKFRDIAKVINQTNVALPQQARSFAVQLSKSFGVPLTKETDPLKQLNTLLTELKARNAAEILGESGKTISDNDRRLVDTIVGGIDIIRGDADIDLLKSKLSRLFKQITASKQDEIDEAYSNLEKFGIKVDREGAGTLGTNMVKGEDNVYRFVAKETT